MNIESDRKKRKALCVSALTIECDVLCEFVIGNYFPTQNIFTELQFSTTI